MDVPGILEQYSERFSAPEIADAQKKVASFLSKRTPTAHISPAMAYVILNSAESNRPISQTAIERLKQTILKGKWSVQVGSVIGFDVNGVITVGHHRMIAIILSDTTIETNLLYGLDREQVMKYEGKGKPWSLADSLAFEGVVRAKDVAAVTMLYTRVKYGEDKASKLPVANSDLPSAGDMVELALAGEAEFDEAVVQGAQGKGSGAPQAVLSTFYMLLPGNLQEQGAEFLRDLGIAGNWMKAMANGRMAAPSSNKYAHMLVAKLSAVKVEQESVRSTTALAWMINAFNTSLDQKRKTIRWWNGKSTYPTIGTSS